MAHQVRKRKCLREWSQSIIIAYKDAFWAFPVTCFFHAGRSIAVVFLEVLFLVVCLVTLSYPSWSIADLSEPDVGFPETVYLQVAKTYYAVQEDVAAQRERVYAGTNKDTKFSPLPLATGWVVNRRGLPIAEASVTITTWEKTPIGEGHTDENGRFTLELSTNTHDGLIIDVLADGYTRYSAGIYGNIVEYPVCLDRSIDNGFVAMLLAEEDPEERLWMLLEIVGTRWAIPSSHIILDEWNNWEAVEALFPYIGHLRNNLLFFARSTVFSQKDDCCGSPADRAIDVLGYWCHEDDEALIRKYLAQSFSPMSPPDISGQTLEAASERWTQFYFHASKNKMSAHEFCPHSISSVDETRGLLHCYDSFGFFMKVLFVKKEGQWELKRVFDMEHIEVH